MVRVCHKLAWINEVWSNLGLRKVNQNTTAPQTISFRRTLQREKQKQRTPWGLRSPQHRKLRFFIHRITALKKHQHRNTANPHVPLKKVTHEKVNVSENKRTKV